MKSLKSMASALLVPNLSDFFMIKNPTQMDKLVV